MPNITTSESVKTFMESAGVTEMQAALRMGVPVFIGEGAGATDPTPDGAVKIGHDAGKNSDSSGFKPVIIGAAAGLEITGLGAHVLIGTDAGGTETGATGGTPCNVSNAIGLGKGALRAANGNVMIGIGHESGRASIGDESVFIGHYAGSNSEGDYSVFLGYSAGAGSVGEGCVFIGQSAGENNTDDGVFELKQITQNASPLMRGSFITGIMELNLKYAPATPGDWAGSPPTTVEEALDRLAAVAASPP